jgi:hypothetical protein
VAVAVEEEEGEGTEEEEAMMPDEEWIVLSNFKLVLLSKGKAHFERAIRIAFAGAAVGGKAVGYCKPAKNTIILFWHEDGAFHPNMSEGHMPSQPLPFELKVDQAVDFLWAWFQSTEGEELGQAPDIDGSVSPNAFYIEAGESPGYSYEILRVSRVWGECHK